MIDAALLDCEQTEGGVTIFTTRPDLGARLDLLPFYDLERTALAAYRGLLIGLHSDQRYLASRRAQLSEFLDRGGTVVFCGQVAYPFLEELSPFRVIENYKIDDLVVNLETPHPVWRGVDAEDLSRRRGVGGFYGRGSNPPPRGATIINTLGPARHPVDYECRRPGGGRLLVHAGNDLWGYLEGETSATRLAPQLLDWIRDGERR